MCFKSSSAPAGPTAEQLALQQQQEADHQAQLASIQAERDAAAENARQLQQQQEQFQAQQSAYVQQLALATAAATSKTAPAAPLSPGTVTTGADAAGSVTDQQADADPDGVNRKRGRAALRIDLTTPVAGASGLNIPVG